MGEGKSGSLGLANAKYNIYNGQGPIYCVYSTGNYIQYPMINYNENGYGKIYN